jgi:hypothetical protein
MILRESPHLLQDQETGVFMWRSIFYMKKGSVILGAIHIGFDTSGMLYAPDTFVVGETVMKLSEPHKSGAMVYREA